MLRGIDSWSLEVSLIINVFQFCCIINIRSEIFSISRDILTVLYEIEYNQSNECYKEKLRIRLCNNFSADNFFYEIYLSGICSQSQNSIYVL